VTFTVRWAELADEGQTRSEAERLHALFELCWDRDLEEHPELATAVGERGQGHRWTDRSLEAVDRRKREVVERLAVLASIDRDRLDDDDRLSYDLFRRQHELAREGQRFPSELLAVGKLDGVHEWVPRTISMMPAFTVGDYEDVVARLHGVSVLVDQVITLLDEGRAGGITPPRITVLDVPRALAALSADPPEASPLLGAFRSFPAGIPYEERHELRAEATEAFVASVVPALRRLQHYLASTYVPACRESISAAALPDGEAWYAHEVRRHTTTGLPPVEIHEIGQAEVARLRGAMEEVIRTTRFSGGFGAFNEFLRTDPRFFFTTAEELLVAYRDIAKRADPELVRLFGTLPRLPYGVVAVPDHEAPSTTTAYYLRGSLEAGRPGLFYANTYDLASRPRWEMEALTLHEAVPGHHLQIALAAELEGLPEFRRMGEASTAYVEGWGLYAESLGEELGFYTDPFARFGQLTYEMWRAVRLVVDTGIHALGWTRDQALQVFRENTGKADHDISVEVDRYISWPGQALAYKIGELKLKELRAFAAAELGDRFDVRAFHDHVLGAGALPLDVLDARMRAWVAQRRT
jgi:uncharacterized protein (DUF885 family)